MQVIDGIIESDSISINNKEIGKILIKNKNPFAIIKINDQNFDFDEIFDCGLAKVKIQKPNWL